MRNLIDTYPNAGEFVWCQEEPKNQGAWFSSQHHLKSVLRQPELLQYAGRPLSAAPAAGYTWLHLKQQHALVALETLDHMPEKAAGTAQDTLGALGGCQHGSAQSQD